MSDQETPKKISPDQIEIIGTGVHAKPGEKFEPQQRSHSQSFGGMKVINAGPLGLLIVPVVLIFLPVLFVGLMVLLVLSAFFGRSVFKFIRMKR